MTVFKGHKWKKLPWKSELRLGPMRKGPSKTFHNPSDSSAEFYKPFYVILNENKSEIHQQTFHAMLNTNK
jgi:hypothetical protein